jgi:hypothetical protein
MKTEVRTEYEVLPDGETGRLWAVVTVDGCTYRTVHVSGPREDVEAYDRGMLTLTELQRRWGKVA